MTWSRSPRPMTDLVYPVRSGPSGAYEELRFSLRSVEQNLEGFGEVWLLGSAPRWATGANQIRVVQNQSKYRNVRRLLREACMSPLVSEPFIWMNDDIFYLHKQSVDTLRLLHGGPLAAYLARTARRDSYGLGGRRTVDLLKRQGYEDPLNWGLHTPLLVRNKSTMLRALDLVGDSSTAYHVRSIYGALEGLTGEQHCDVKIMTGKDVSPAWPYVSTSDVSFQTRQVGALVRKRFSVPSRFEH